MKREPYVSIVIPTYNRVHDLKKAVASVLRQDEDSFEIIISDNHSTDATASVAMSWRDPRIRYVRTLRHIPVQQNIQFAIGFAKGRYVMLLGDDDFLMTESLLRRLRQRLDSDGYGVVRLNYLSLTPDKTGIFDFRASKHFASEHVLPAHSAPIEIVRFIQDMDASFMSGIVFTRNIPTRDLRVLSSELNSWFPIVYAASLRYGALYWAEPEILASWSVWRPARNQVHPLYSLHQGKLSAEPYFEEVEKYLPASQLHPLLRQLVEGVYVTMFPAAKYFTGNRNLIQLAKRTLHLVPKLRHSARFWAIFIIALCSPNWLLHRLRSVMLRRRIDAMQVKTPRVLSALAYYRTL